MRNRRSENRRTSAGFLEGAGIAVSALWERVACRPVDSVAIFGATVASLFIVVNAVFLQSTVHPAQSSAHAAPPLRSVAAVEVKPAQAPAVPYLEQMPQAPVRPATIEPARAAQPAATRRADPIAALIEPSPRVMAVQHALSEHGYGQIRATGFFDEATRVAIERFERIRRLPVTGRISDRLVSELSALTGHRLD